ncbi:DUF421 domain-containing protein [bacterium]|nr:DUF421 domain-containing protein [bacterium]
MYNDLFHFQVPFLDLTIRSIVVYLFILILLRISGKRQMGQMSPTEFVAILLISNAVQNSMNGGDNSLVGGLLLALVLVSVSNLIAYLTYRSRFFSSVFEGTPTLLVHKGKVLTKNLHHERMTENELKVLLRKQGLHSLNEIETAILEADGTLSATKQDK